MRYVGTKFVRMRFCTLIEIGLAPAIGDCVSVRRDCTGGLYVVRIDVQIYVHALVYCTMIEHGCVACKRGHDKPDAEA